MWQKANPLKQWLHCWKLFGMQRHKTYNNRYEGTREINYRTVYINHPIMSAAVFRVIDNWTSIQKCHWSRVQIGGLGAVLIATAHKSDCLQTYWHCILGDAPHYRFWTWWSISGLWNAAAHHPSKASKVRRRPSPVCHRASRRGSCHCSMQAIPPDKPS